MKLFSPSAAPDRNTLGAVPADRQRLQFIIALRAIASFIILWHHFALYAPLSEWSAPLAGPLLDWLAVNARATQVFFVVGGYVLARSMSRKDWHSGQLWAFVVQRYCRLGVPYLGAVVLVIPAYVVARGWLPEDVVGSPVSFTQLLAHLFFLQDILGYEQLSAGLWFVCINFQLGLMLAAMFWLRDALARRGLWQSFDVLGVVGWTLSLFSLFFFNLNDDWDRWALYFFPYFYLGVIIQRSLVSRAGKWEFLAYQAVLVAAMCFEWRWRLLSAFVVGCLLYSAEHAGWGARWPNNRLVIWLGNLSYSLFLVHFPVLVLIATVWTRMGWHSPMAALCGLLCAFCASLLTASLFYRWVERPSSRLGRAQPVTLAAR